jgi:hypothetical protein
LESGRQALPFFQRFSWKSGKRFDHWEGKILNSKESKVLDSLAVFRIIWQIRKLIVLMGEELHRTVFDII